MKLTLSLHYDGNLFQSPDFHFLGDPRLYVGLLQSFDYIIFYTLRFRLLIEEIISRLTDNH